MGLWEGRELRARVEPRGDRCAAAAVDLGSGGISRRSALFPAIMYVLLLASMAMTWR